MRLDNSVHDLAEAFRVDAPAGSHNRAALERFVMAVALECLPDEIWSRVVKELDNYCHLEQCFPGKFDLGLQKGTEDA